MIHKYSLDILTSIAYGILIFMIKKIIKWYRIRKAVKEINKPRKYIY